VAVAVVIVLVYFPQALSSAFSALSQTVRR
jgi:hypothetical protein